MCRTDRLWLYQSNCTSHCLCRRGMAGWTWERRGEKGEFRVFIYVGGGLGVFLRAVSPLVRSRRGVGPFSQLLVSSLFPLGMTAEAVAALRRPALGRQWRETNLTHSRLWGPSCSRPSAQANRDEFMAPISPSNATRPPVVPRTSFC